MFVLVYDSLIVSWSEWERVIVFVVSLRGSVELDVLRGLFSHGGLDCMCVCLCKWLLGFPQGQNEQLFTYVYA